MFLNFINRKNEISFLDERYSSSSFEFIVVYGRRRVGKTELIKHFLSRKEGIYLLCDKSGTELNIGRLKGKISEKLKEPVIATNDLEEIFKHISKQKLAVIFDEFPYLVERDSSFLSVFQRAVDEAKSANLKIIICGSSITMMESLLGYKNPLYARKTGHIKLLAISLKEYSEFFPENTIEKNIEFLSIVGGIPYYMEKFSFNKSAVDNALSEILNKEGRLYEEIDFLLKEELREPDVYKSVLLAISSGKTKSGEIANLSNIKINDIDKYLKTLIRLGLIKREIPITEHKKSKKALYKIDDNFFHFWFRFAEAFKSDLEIKNMNLVRLKLNKEFNSYVGVVFEDICKEILVSELSNKNFSIGKWWDKENEIDIAAINNETKEIVFAECKWSDNVDAGKVYDRLKEKAKIVNWNNENRKEKYVIFGKSFANKTMQKHLRVIDLEEIERMLR
ncbi:MAG: ATP-binding protein [archaeon]